MNIKRSFSNINSVAFRRGNGEQGSTLVVVLVMMATMFAIAVGALKVTELNVTSSGAHKKGKQAFYAAEVGLDVGINDIITEFENLSVYTTTAADGGSPHKTISNYRGHDVTYNITNPLDRYLYRTVVGNGTIFHYAHTFNVEATSTSRTDNSKESVNESIRILETPLVQYFAFYAGDGDLADLELYPGTDMDIWGRMHANRDMYLLGRGNDIIIANHNPSGIFSPHFVSMGGIFRGKQKAYTTVYGATDTWVRINDNQTIIGSPTSTPAEYLEIPVNVTSANETTVENNFNDYFHINEKQYQAPDQTQFWRNGFYEGRSRDPQNPRIDGMTILGTGTGPDPIRVWVARPTLTEVTNEIINGGTAILHSDSSAMVNNPIENNTSAPLYDERENKLIDFTDIDLNLLGVWYADYLIDEGLSWAGDGMLIYVSRSGTGTIPNPNSGTRLQAIRLRTQGGSIPRVRANTTLATDNPIYIQGDFNTDNTVGVALVSDATNILSNNFSTKANNGWPTASNTTVNAAFFSGITPNVFNSGNRVGGGLHNYARLHENWGNTRTLTINGSFVSLWQSTQATGDWCHGSSSRCYYRPNRAFGWDVNFQDPNFWPPFIPSIFSVERVGFLEGS